MTDYEKPSEMTYRDYMEHVETAADVALEAMEEYPPDFRDISDGIHYAIDGSRLIHNYGYMLMTVLLSDNSPEDPDYCERWQMYVDLKNDPTWSDCVSEMAYVCHYSDVMANIKRRDDIDL